MDSPKISCPNCKFDVDPGVDTCPFCQFVIPVESQGIVAPDKPGGESSGDMGESEAEMASLVNEQPPEPSPLPGPGGEIEDPVETPPPFDEDAVTPVPSELHTPLPASPQSPQLQPTPAPTPVPQQGQPTPVPSELHTPLPASPQTPAPTPLPQQAPPPRTPVVTPLPDTFAAPDAKEDSSGFRKELKKNLILGTVAAVLGFGGYNFGLFDNLLQLFGIRKAASAKAAAPAPAAPSEPVAVAKADTPPSVDPSLEVVPTADSAPAAPNQLLDPRLAAVASPEQRRKLAEMGLLGDKELPAAKVKKKPEVAYWAFSGVVYDMVTLRPVSGATMLFIGDGKQKEVRTNSRGRYQIRLRGLKNGGYKVIVDHPEYLADYFPERNPPYHQRALSARLKMRSVNPKNRFWRGKNNGRRRRDIILFPEVTDQ